MTAPDTLARHEAKTEPPKRWRNWWRARTDSVQCCSGCGYQIQRMAGESHPSHCNTWPSKDEAEAAAALVMLQDTLEDGYSPADYLGAYPEPAP